MNMRDQVEKRLEVTPFHQSILDEFGTLSFAARKLGFKRGTLYLWIRAGKVTDERGSRKRVEANGYNPDTFKHL